MTYHVRLSQFEGPLDLLLHLIFRDKINIYDIPISHITREYLAYIEIMQELQLEVAGEFFVMAATLMRIKAQMLLPRQASEEEEEDPRDELVRNLLEYKKFKEVAQHLAEREDDRRKVFTRPPLKLESESAEVPALEVTLFDLVGAFRKVLDDLKKQVSYRIDRESVTIEEKIGLIRRRVEDRSEVLFSELFDTGMGKMDVIVTFLAILELIRLGEIVARQMSIGTDIWLYRPGNTAYIQANRMKRSETNKEDAREERR
ncbi:MAG: segregation/condensation protein A [bacterium]|nr:MAG: segregation/condensation protein A [bacterium]